MKGFAALGALLAASLLYLALLDWLWLPGKRTVRVEYRCHAACTLAATPDIGRGFLGIDTRRRELARNETTTDLGLPHTSARVALTLEPSDAGQIRRVSELKPSGSVPLPAGPDASVRTFPLFREEVPLIAHALCGLAVLALGLTLANRRARERLRELDSLLFGARFATPRSLLAAALLLAGALFVAASAADAFHGFIRRIDNPPYWPISIFDFAPFSPRSAFGAVFLVLAAYFVVTDLSKAPPSSPAQALALGLAGLVLGNLIQGWQAGFVQPTAGEQTYYSESLAVTDVLSYLGSYDERQLGLGTHARTHPAGAVLLFFALRAIVANPGVISLLLGAGAFTFAVWNLFGLARHFVDARSAAFAALLFALLPSVQVYFIIALEAVMAALLIGAARCFLDVKPLARYAGTFALTFAALSLSFGALFLLPVLFVYELLTERRAVRTLSLVAALAAAFALQRSTTGFDWFHSLDIATQLENRHGFALLVNPGSYLFTRLEGIAEVCLFASPLILTGCVAAFRGHFTSFRKPLLLSAIGLGTWLAMLAAGAFKTGETARACLFVTPFLVLPLAVLHQAGRLQGKRRTLLGVALAAQTVLMQLAGQYYW